MLHVLSARPLACDFAYVKFWPCARIARRVPDMSDGVRQGRFKDANQISLRFLWLWATLGRSRRAATLRLR